MNFTQSAGLKKTYAHRWLFDINSHTLNAIIDEIIPADNNGAIRILFKNMFVELNKKHVNAGIAEFAPNLFSAKIEKILGSWSQDTYGITSAQYNEMRTFCKPLYGVFVGDTYAKEIYENKFLLDAIHEAVILYFPTEYVSVSLSADDRKLIESARTDLQQSLTGYIGDRKAYIEVPNKIPATILELSNVIKDIKHKFDSLPNVVHLEAVAELYRHSFLTVDKKDALSVIAHAHVSSPPLIQSMIDYLKETLPGKTINFVSDSTFSVGNETYLVYYDKKGFSSEKYEHVDIGQTDVDAVINSLKFDLNAAHQNPVTYIDDLVKQFVKMIPSNKKGSEGSEGSDNKPGLILDLSGGYGVYRAIGDGNCFYHAFLHLSQTYILQNTGTKSTLGDMFRVYIAKYAFDSIDQNWYVGESGDAKREIGWPVSDSSWKGEPTFMQAVNKHPRKYVDTDILSVPTIISGLFNIGINVINEIEHSGAQKILEKIQEEELLNGELKIAMKFNGYDHFDIIMRNANGVLTPILHHQSNGGGSNKKAKTRKSRIFKKWKSRRRRM